MDERWNFEVDEKTVIKKPLKISPQKRKTALQLEFCAYEVFRSDQLPSHLQKQFTHLHKYGYDEFVEQYHNPRIELISVFVERLSVKCDDLSLLVYSVGDIFHVKQFFVNMYGWRFDHFWIVQNSFGLVGLVYCANLRLLGGKQMRRGERMLCKSISNTGRGFSLEDEFNKQPLSEFPDSNYSSVNIQRTGIFNCSSLYSDNNDPQELTSSTIPIISTPPPKGSLLLLGDVNLLSTPHKKGLFSHENISINTTTGKALFPSLDIKSTEALFVYTKTLPPCIDNFKTDLFRVRVKYYGSRKQKKGDTYSCALFNSYESAVLGGALIRDTLELFGVIEFRKLRDLLLNELCTDEISSKIATKKSVIPETMQKFRRDHAKLYPLHTPRSTEVCDREAAIAFGHRMKFDYINLKKKIGYSLEIRQALQNNLVLLCKRVHIASVECLKTVLLYSHRVSETHDSVSALFRSLIDVEGEHLLYKIGTSNSTVVRFCQIMYANNLSTLPGTMVHSFFDYLWYYAFLELFE
jgi:hypothetical protein